MKRSSLKLFALGCAVALLAGCATSKDIVYFQDIDSVQLGALKTEYEATIKKDDFLSIVVSGPDKMVTAPYNLTLADISQGFSSGSDPDKATLGYLVDCHGDISFPILGTIHVEGMTRNQLVEYLMSEIGKDVKDPVVYVSFRNFKVTVLGEVRNPGTFLINSEKINILQALGMAGDMQLTAQRSDIILLREIDGVQTHHKIDLRRSDILESPYFYLQQNDVLIVPPSATRVASATAATGIWGTILSSITTSIAVISLVLSLSK